MELSSPKPIKLLIFLARTFKSKIKKAPYFLSVSKTKFICFLL